MAGAPVPAAASRAPFTTQAAQLKQSASRGSR